MKGLLFCLLLSAAAWGRPLREARLQAEVDELVARSGAGNVACSLVDVASGEAVEVAADQPMALASVFKLPLMLEAARQMQAPNSSLKLSTQLKIRASDKCVGSGNLKDQPTGTAVSVERLIEAMETRSDNTATDMLFRRLGLDSVDRFMREQGCPNSQIFLTNRAAWLISLAHSSDFRGLTPRAIAARWKSFSLAQKRTAAENAERENQGLSLGSFQALEDESARTASDAENTLVATSVDNKCSARDLALLLRKLAAGELLDKRWSDYCLGVLGRQRYNTRIPRLLPDAARCYHKTGTIAGVVNDAGIVRGPNGHSLVVVVLVQNVPSGRDGVAEQLIAQIARAGYKRYCVQ